MSESGKPWFDIRADYEAGVKPISHICSEYNISRSSLESYANKFNWVRNEVITKKSQLFAGYPVSEIPGLSIDDLEDRAALTQAQIINVHRRDVARMRSVTSTILVRLEMMLAGKIEDIVDENGNPLPFIGSRESPADLVGKLSQTMHRTVQIERQAYNLDSYNPDEGKDRQEQEDLAKNLWERLEAVISEKAVD